MTQRSTASPPELVGYDFIRILGSGGFSDVYLYEQKFPKRQVAVKILLADDLTEATKTAFTAEANLMAQLSAHPYIVTIYHADVAVDDRPYFVMEYCSGPSLGDRYKREQFKVADVLQIGIRLSSAVATAHSVGILHRDIKPANVLTNDFGWPALTDFGISSAVESEVLSQTTTSARVSASDTGATSSSASVGMSIPWSPPEMFDDDPEPDVRSDVFSLAATIYTLLAGHTPFEVSGRSNSSVDLVGRIVRGSITPMARTDVPRSLLAVLQKGMSANRSERFATAVDFARALQRVELELSYSQTPIDVPNLLIKAPERELVDDGPDPEATRARTISTVRAQEPSNAVSDDRTKARPLATPVIPSPPSADRTVARAKPAAIVPTETVVRRAPVSSEAEPEELVHGLKPRRSRRTGIISLVVGLAVVAAVIVGIVLFAPKTSSLDTSGGNGTDSDGQSAIIGGAVPTPVLVDATRNGAEVTFTWSNPAPEDGDKFLWQRTDGASSDHQVNSTSDPSAVISGVDSGSKVCISVDIRRENGSVSANSLEACFPQ